MTTRPDKRERLFFGPALIYIDPTDLSAGESGFGTLLGITDQPVDWSQFYKFSMEGAWDQQGQTPRDELVLGGYHEFTTRVVSWNRHVIQLAFPHLAISGEAAVADPGPAKTGANLASTTYGRRVLIHPSESNPSVPVALLQLAVGHLNGRVQFGVTDGEPIKIPLMLRTYRRGAGDQGALYIGKLSGATLV